MTGIPRPEQSPTFSCLCVSGPCSSLCLICFSSHSHHPSSHSFLIHARQPTFPPTSLLQQSPSGGAFPDQPSNHPHPNTQADRSVPCSLFYCPMYRCCCQPSHWFNYLPIGLPPLWIVNSWGKELGLFLHGISDLALHLELEILFWKNEFNI